jgi:hypothetical protein
LGDGGWVIGNKLKHIYMSILIGAIVILLVISIVYALIGSIELTFGLELNTLTSPFYKLGIFFQRYSLEDGTVEDELVIGLFFINIVMVAWKENEA